MAGSGTAHLSSDDVILRAEELVVEFPVGRTGQKVHAVSGISLDIAEGETLGLVGESGCGKSTTGRALLQAPQPTSGSVQLDGNELTSLDRESVRQLRPRMQMIFQDPVSSLNPRRTIHDIVAEPLDIWWAESFPRSAVSRLYDRFRPAAVRSIDRAAGYSRSALPILSLAIVLWVISEAVEGRGAEDALGWTQGAAAIFAIIGGIIALPVVAAAAGGLLGWLALTIALPFASIPRSLRMRRARPAHRAEADAKVVEMLTAVGINAEDALDRRPHEFSGGQAQRISIARALVLEPQLIICDEPVSALDVSVQAQVLNILEDLKVRYGLTLVFIAHDLAVVKNISDRVAVMYLGKMCEVAPPDTLYASPAHPYTFALLSSVPVPDPDVIPQTPQGIAGDLPSPIDPPSGCRFRTRCPRAEDRCAEDEPTLRAVADGHFVACHFPLSPGEEAAAPSDESFRAKTEVSG